VEESDALPGSAFAEQACTNVVVHRQIGAAEKTAWNAGRVLERSTKPSLHNEAVPEVSSMSFSVAVSRDAPVRIL